MMHKCNTILEMRMEIEGVKKKPHSAARQEQDACKFFNIYKYISFSKQTISSLKDQ